MLWILHNRVITYIFGGLFMYVWIYVSWREYIRDGPIGLNGILTHLFVSVSRADMHLIGQPN